MSRSSGVVIECNGPKPLIAVAEGLISFNSTSEKEHFQIGDSVTYIPSQTSQGAMVATQLQKCKSVVPTKIHEGELLLKCKILRVSEIAGNQRIFETDFFRNITAEPCLKHVSANALIGKKVFIHTDRTTQLLKICKIQAPKNMTKSVTGFAYVETVTPPSVRVFVPGYPEDFILPNTMNIKTKNMIDSWVEFQINVETASVDLGRPLRIPENCITQVEIQCSKVGDSFKTEFGEIVGDPNDEIGKRKIPEDFNSILLVALKSGHPKKPIFELIKHQPSLCEFPIVVSAKPEEVILPSLSVPEPEQEPKKQKSKQSPSPKNRDVSSTNGPSEYKPGPTNRPRGVTGRPVHPNETVEGFSVHHQHYEERSPMNHQPPPVQRPLYYRPSSQNDVSRNNSGSGSSGSCFAHSGPAPAYDFFNRPSSSDQHSTSRFTEQNEGFDPHVERNKKLFELLTNQLNDKRFAHLLEHNFPEFLYRLDYILRSN